MIITVILHVLVYLQQILQTMLLCFRNVNVFSPLLSTLIHLYENLLAGS